MRSFNILVIICTKDLFIELSQVSMVLNEASPIHDELQKGFQRFHSSPQRWEYLRKVASAPQVHTPGIRSHQCQHSSNQVMTVYALKMVKVPSDPHCGLVSAFRIPRMISVAPG